ncbi:hypothetical protein KEM54_006957 [Ascosphaera aggregata]|nr:hypothetical protein KEM54_006957 [Ascosphaera aggregata]
MSYSIPAIAIPGQRLGPCSAYASGPGTHLHGSYICASITGPVIIEETEIPAKPYPRKKQTLLVGRPSAITTMSVAPLIQAAAAAGNGPAIVRKVAPASSAGGKDSTATPTATATTASKSAKEKSKYNTLPAVDSIILGRITRVQKRQANISILVVLDEDVTTLTSSSSSLPPLITSTSQHDFSPNQIASILASAAPATVSADNNNSEELRFQATIRKEDVRAVEKDRVVMDEMFRVGDIVRASVISLGDQTSYYVTTARNEFGVVMARSEEGNMMFPVSWREMRDPVTGKMELRKVAKPY